jgi:signal transduction histidine kinase
MRLLQVNLRGLLLYSLILVLISIPVSLVSIQAILNEEVDESISLQADQFLRHIKGFEYLDDLETDLKVFDQLSYNIHIKPTDSEIVKKSYSTITLYDSLEKKIKPFRQVSTSVVIKDKPYVLTVEMSLVDNDELVMAIGMVQVALSILLTAGLLLLNRSLSKRLWKPFYKTLDQLKAYQLDKGESITVEKSHIIEFNDLNKTVSHLTERNRKVYLDQKEFIENASHELQTPIAIFQGKLDTLMQSPNLSQADAETIMELESTAQRMSRLNKNLLLLSKIDNEQFLSTEEVELSAIVKNQLNSLNMVAQMQDLKINAALEPLTLTTNKTLIEILITNLFHNAFRHSPKGEQIEIVLDGRKLSVSNKGKPLNMTFLRMTERFVKDSSDPNSTGLGLAIVKKICDTTGYKFDYSFRNDTHIFSIIFDNR